MMTLRSISCLFGLALFGVAGALPASAQQAQPQPQSQPPQSQDGYQTGMIKAPHIMLPQDKNLKGMVFLISGASGWGATEESEAANLLKNGAAVVGIDFPTYIQSLSADEGDCVYMISDVEDLSQQVQRRVGNATYRHPIIAGIGDGGALALAMISQSPPTTVGEAIAVNPTAGIPLAKELCTPATKDVKGDRTIYGFQDEDLPADVTIAFTPDVAAGDDGRAHAKSLKDGHQDVDIQDVAGPADAALAALLDESLKDAAGTGDQALDMPLTILDTKPTSDTMAIIYSGDGGWRDIDSEIGGYLQGQGVPVVGVDSLRYFWTEKTADQTAKDMAKIIETYRKKWNVQNVVLVGYSFGADIIPASYNLLPKATKVRVRQMSLLALAKEVDFVISVTGWLGVAGEGKGGNTLTDLAKVDPKVVQCIYGTDEDDDPCVQLKSRGVEAVAIEGGHHFDEDYEALGKHILDSLKTRLTKK